MATRESWRCGASTSSAAGRCSRAGREVADYRGDLIRGIKGIRVSQDLFDDLARPRDEKQADLDVAIAAESATRIPSPAPLITRPFDYGTVIRAFAPHNWHATRYSDGLEYGVWYGALEIETTTRNALPLASLHPGRLSNLEHEVVGERRVFQVRCEAILIDLRAD